MLKFYCKVIPNRFLHVIKIMFTKFKVYTFIRLNKQTNCLHDPLSLKNIRQILNPRKPILQLILYLLGTKRRLSLTRTLQIIPLLIRPGPNHIQGQITILPPLSMKFVAFGCANVASPGGFSGLGGCTIESECVFEASVIAAKDACVVPCDTFDDPIFHIDDCS